MQSYSETPQKNTPKEEINKGILQFEWINT